jgi:ATP/ADP translocase
MKKVGYKLSIAFVFTVFVVCAKLIFTKNVTPINEVIISKEFWSSFLMFFAVGYVLLGNILWASKQKNK